MTEEEKKAIEYLENRLEILHNNTQWSTENSIKVVLNLIDKQQKEIEQLANGIRVLGTNSDITTEEIIKEFTENPISEEYMKEFKSKYISKNKIEDKIKELEEYQKQHKEGNWADIPIEDYDFDKINLLKELLEEN